MAQFALGMTIEILEKSHIRSEFWGKTGTITELNNSSGMIGLVIEGMRSGKEDGTWYIPFDCLKPPLSIPYFETPEECEQWLNMQSEIG